MQVPSVYIPMDRRQALARGATLPEQTEGAALFADVSGFTPLAQAFAVQLGPQRGAEELTFYLNRVYDALITQVHTHGGSVIGFVGDAITCWFDGPLVETCNCAVACALAMQTAMARSAEIVVAPGVTTALSIKIGVATGPVRRFCVGDPDIQLIDVLAGETLRRMSQAEGLARRGEVLVDESAIDVTTERAEPVLGSSGTPGGAEHQLGPLGPSDTLEIAEWRTHPDSGRRLGLVTAISRPVAPRAWPPLSPDALDADQVRPWVLPALYERLVNGTKELRAELRPAVSLFVRFSGLDYDNDPTAGAKLDGYIRWVQRIVTRHGGNVIELTIGDKGSFFYAAFGAPIAHDDDTLRAVRAALEIEAGFEGMIAQIGVARGPARTGAYGSATRRSYGVIGDDAVLAARLMTAAPPGEIRCAHSIYTQTRARIAFESLPPVQVKGRTEPVLVYRPSASAVCSATAPAAALIGRRVQLAQLRTALDAVEAGATRVVFVQGEAGIGKTRLMQELSTIACRRGLAPLLGTGQSIEQLAPYRAWRDVFTACLGLETLTEPETRRRRVQDIVAQIAPEQQARLPLLNVLLDLELPETPLTAALDPNLYQQNLQLLLLALLRAQARPLIVILEDAHWLDDLSWQFAERVARIFSVHSIPLLLVIVHRPLETPYAGESAFGALQSLPIRETLHLEGLEAAEIAELVARRLSMAVETLPAVLTGLVQARSGGNPFFAEELIHALHDAGAIETRPDGDPPLSITGDLDQAAQTLPDTLHGLILARIDRLPVKRQFVLKVAAVIGRSFGFTPLHVTFDHWYAPITPAALRAELSALDQSDFTFVEALEPEPTYIFKHIITQEAAYQTLLFAQRRELHALVAEWYAAQPVQYAHLPLLVHHYHRAELPAKERRYARLAGEQAARYYDNANAVRYLSRALELTPQTESDERIALLLEREAVYDVLGERAAQTADIATLTEVATSSGDDRQHAIVALRQALYASIVDDYPTALKSAQQAVQLAARCGDMALETQGLQAWGRVLGQQGELAASLDRLEQALAIALQCGDRRQAARSVYDIGTTLYDQADYTRARVYYDQAQSLYRELEDKRGLARCALMFGALHYQLGEYVAAQEKYRQALIESQAIGWRYGEAFALNSLGNNLFELGDYRAAQTYHEQALSIGREIGHREGIALSLDTLGLIHTMLGDYAQALTCGQEALSLQREIEDTYSVGYTLNHLGLAWLGMNEPKQAEAVFTEAFRLRRELGQAAATLDDLAGLARVALLDGALSRAKSLVADILAGLQEQSVEGVEFPVLVYLTCYHVLSAAGEDAQARDALAAGRHLVEARAAAIQDRSLRAQFLENAPFNRELLAA